MGWESSGRPRTPCPQPVHDLLPQVPLELDRIIQKAMAPRRRDRYQTVEDLAVDLKRLGSAVSDGSLNVRRIPVRPTQPPPWTIRPFIMVILTYTSPKS